METAVIAQKKFDLIAELLKIAKINHPDIEITLDKIKGADSFRFVALYVRRKPRLETMSYCGDTEEEAIRNMIIALDKF